MTTKKSTAPGEPVREIVVSRLIDAPRERVWEAWADPEQIAKWWGPNGFTTKTKEREFKPGGVWRHTMIGPDGVEYPNLARFEEVVRPERIVYTNGGGRPGDPGVHFRATVTFVDRGGKTELTLRLVFDTPEQRDRAATEYGAIEGGRQTLERLASHVAGEFVLSRLVDASRERVWKAWTEPEQLKAWFGPKDFETFYARLDLRPGGVYHYGIRHPSSGTEMWGKWTFREIVAPERLVFLQAFSDRDEGLGRHPMAPDWPPQMLATILFADFGGKTLVTIKSLPYEASEIERKTFGEGFASMRQGWGGTFARLDAQLTAPFKRAGMNTTALRVTAPSDREIRTERIFNASRERVWRAFTDPKQIAQWWGRGHPLAVERMEVERGGHWRYVEHAPDGVHGFEGRYREVTPPERLVQTFEWDGMPGYVAVTTTTFEDLGDGRTRLITVSLFHTTEERDGMLSAGMEQGLSESYTALERLLAREDK